MQTGLTRTNSRVLSCLVGLGLLITVPVVSLAAGVSVKLDFSSPTTSPFPSDRFTRPDWTQNTFKRVKLPKPDCTVQISDCADIDVINTLDGFNTQPRVTVPFTGDIDLASVTSSTVYLVNLGDTLSGSGFGHKVGVNQISWDVGAKALVFESDELLEEHWVQQSGNPVSYAAYIRKQPLPGNSPKPVIVQFAKGDETVPNPTTTAILRAGDLADRALYFRNDLAYALTGGMIPKNPHTFLTNIGIAAAAPFAVAAQTQIAIFFASNGTSVIDPDGGGPIFEMPITPPLPEGLNFLP